MKLGLLVAAVALAGCSDSGDTAPPGSPPTGAVSFTWTVGGMPAATGCPSAAMVTISGGSYSKTVPCSDGLLVSDPLAPGDVTFHGALDGFTAPDQPVTVTANQVVPAAFAFVPANAATLTVRWTINGGQNCPTGAMVSAGLLQGGTVAALQTVSCDSYQVVLDNVVPATYTARVLIDSGGMQAMTDQMNVAVPAGPSTVGPIDVSCSFCP